jgi:hypothetical protein
MLATGGILGICIFLFLQVFQPFGLSELPQTLHKTLILAGYGVITFCVVAINGTLLPTIFRRTYSPARWTLLKDLLYFGVLNFLSVSVVNVFYSSWAFGYPVSANRLLFAIFSTFTVGLLPFALLLLYHHNKLLRQNLLLAGEMNDQLPTAPLQPPPTSTPNNTPTNISVTDTNATITIQSDNGYEQLTFAPNDFLYAESADNYVRFVLHTEGKTLTKMLRLTMKQAEEQLSPHTGVVRCHRSYLVNVHRVRHVEGNAQGLRLTLHGADAEIPVARSTVSSIRTLLHTP